MLLDSSARHVDALPTAPLITDPWILRRRFVTLSDTVDVRKYVRSALKYES